MAIVLAILAAALAVSSKSFVGGLDRTVAVIGGLLQIGRALAVLSRGGRLASGEEKVRHYV